VGFRHEDRLADSPFAQAVWYAQSEGGNCYIASADSGWDILIVKHKGETKLFLHEYSRWSHYRSSSLAWLRLETISKIILEK
jgi:hypothetical protein